MIDSRGLLRYNEADLHTDERSRIMSTVTIRSLTIGDGHCRVIVPLVADCYEDVVRDAAALAAQKPDMIEWRADYIAELRYNHELLVRCLQRIRRRIGEIPLLVTWRTQKEGGQMDLTAEDYEAFCRVVCESGCADLLDVELKPTRYPTKISGVYVCRLTITAARTP